MCWMTIQRSDDGNAAAEAVEAIRKGELISGGHSWGLAIPTDDGELDLIHGLGYVPADADAIAAEYDADVALGHSRMATRGDVNIANAHPFPIHDADDNVVAALAHNGTWYDAPKTDRCDSYYIAKLAETFVREGHDIKRAVREAGAITGETVVVVTADGTGFVFSGRFEITEVDNGVASSGGEPIDDGTLTAV